MGRSLRADCSALSAGASEAEVAAALLGDWARSSGRGVAIEVQEALRGADVSLLDAVRYIFDSSADAAGVETVSTAYAATDAADAAGAADATDADAGLDADAASHAGAAAGRSPAPGLPAPGPPALVINLDEAHLLRAGTLAHLLRQALRLLLVHGLRVFVLVTGVHAPPILADVAACQLRAHEIFLPPLTPDDMAAVAAAFLPEADSGRRALREALWWLGGVPRFLEYFLGAAAAAVAAAGLSRPSGPRAQLAAYLKALEPAGAASLVSSLAARQWGHSLVPAHVLEDAFCLSVAEAPVPRTCMLGATAAGGGAAGGVSVQDAQRWGLLYWRPLGDAGLGVIEIPPLVLLWWRQQQQRYRPGPSRPLSAMQCFVPWPSRRDSEGLAVSVLLHKARAAALVGEADVTLSRLGIPVHPTLVPDVSVRLPGCFSVVRTDGGVTAGSFRALVECVRRSAAPASTPAAFVNGSGAAPFADAFIVLPDLIIFIQDGRRAPARLTAARANPAAPAATHPSDSPAEPTELSLERPAELLDACYALLGAYATSQPHVFLYLTDDDALATGASGANRCVVARDGHERLLGALCAHLRASSRELDDADARATADGATTAGAAVGSIGGAGVAAAAEAATTPLE